MKWWFVGNSENSVGGIMIDWPLKTLLGIVVGLFLALPKTGLQQTSVQNPESQHCLWVQQSLQKIKTIKVGMTRADLLKVFTTQGGLYTPIQRTYVFRECPYLKVDVEFTPVGRPARDAEGRVTREESDRDLINKISVPYIALSIID
jgi:hypothetical protein